jgi:hypothetical protein
MCLLLIVLLIAAFQAIPVLRLSIDVSRFTFSVAVIVEAEKEKLKCLGKAQKDKKQARESAASAMLSILQERGMFCGS